MKIIILFSLFVCSLGSVINVPLVYNRNAKVPQLDGRIVGGFPVDISDFPYQISFLYFNSHICGGSILSQRWILTAAHCIIANSASAFSVRAGSSIRNSGGETRSSSAIYVHANYNSNTFQNDIALALLASNLDYQNGIAAVSLPTANQEIPAGTTGIVSGWGTTSEGGSAATTLQAVYVPIVSQTVCRSSYGSSITDDMLCAGYQTGGYDACQGDSGGPMVADGYGQIGIVSWGSGCARPNFYGVYASVPYLRNWITTVSGL